MKTIALVILLPVLLLGTAGCKTRSLPYSASVTLGNDFVIDQVGTFTEQKVFTPYDVGQAFNLPSKARVKSVQIESLDLETTLQPNDVATAMKATGKIAGTNTATQTMFQDYPVPLIGGKVTQTVLNDLIFAGIDQLKGNLETMIKNIGTGAGNNVTVFVSGVSVPAGQRMVIGLTLHITATVQYEVCETVPWGDIGDPCPEDQPSPL